MNVPRIVSSKDDKDMSEILFHHNDHEMYQMHQDEQSICKPDVVVVPRKSAHAMQDHGDLNASLDVFGKARQKLSKEHFQWRNVRSAAEFKRSRRAGGRIKMKHPAMKYEVADYASPKEKYLELSAGNGSVG